MEAYKALCEQRIMELDPDHPMPVMPFHLGTPAIGVSDVGENGPGDIKRQLALKE